LAGDHSIRTARNRMCRDAVDRALERYTGEPPEIWF